MMLLLIGQMVFDLSHVFFADFKEENVILT